MYKIIYLPMKINRNKYRLNVNKQIIKKCVYNNIKKKRMDYNGFSSTHI